MVTNLQRYRVLKELADSEEGLTLTALNQKLGWNKKKDTEPVLDDLTMDGALAFADYLTPWVSTHHKGTLVTGMSWLHRISPKGEEFIRQYEESEAKLDQLRKSEPMHYSEA